MRPLTQLAHAAVAEILEPGDIAIDLTAGNGHDTLFMARCVGSTGHVYAFDIQSTAIQATRELLIKLSVESVVTLQAGSHAQWSMTIPMESKHRIKAVMMNLGYLPGGNKSIMTQTDSTLAAIDSALEWLQPGGLLSVLVYTGHPGGQREADAVQSKLLNLDLTRYEIRREPLAPTPDSPILYLVNKSQL